MSHGGMADMVISDQGSILSKMSGNPDGLPR